MIEHIRFTMLIFVAQINLKIKIYILDSERNVDTYKFSNVSPPPRRLLKIHINLYL